MATATQMSFAPEDVANCMPHQLDVYRDGNHAPYLVIPTSGTIARVEEAKTDSGNIFIGEIPVPVVSRKQYKPVILGLPDPLPKALIVSALTAQVIVDNALCPGVSIFSPDTGVSSVVRDAKGAILGVRGLERWR